MANRQQGTLGTTDSIYRNAYQAYLQSAAKAAASSGNPWAQLGFMLGTQLGINKAKRADDADRQAANDWIAQNNNTQSELLPGSLSTFTQEEADKYNKEILPQIQQINNVGQPLFTAGGAPQPTPQQVATNDAAINSVAGAPTNNIASIANTPAQAPAIAPAQTSQSLTDRAIDNVAGKQVGDETKEAVDKVLSEEGLGTNTAKQNDKQSGISDDLINQAIEASAQPVEAGMKTTKGFNPNYTSDNFRAWAKDHHLTSAMTEEYASKIDKEQAQNADAVYQPQVEKLLFGYKDKDGVQHEPNDDDFISALGKIQEWSKYDPTTAAQYKKYAIDNKINDIQSQRQLRNSLTLQNNQANINMARDAAKYGDGYNTGTPRAGRRATGGITTDGSGDGGGSYTPSGAGDPSSPNHNPYAFEPGTKEFAQAEKNLRSTREKFIKFCKDNNIDFENPTAIKNPLVAQQFQDYSNLLKKYQLQTGQIKYSQNTDGRVPQNVDDMNADLNTMAQNVNDISNYDEAKQYMSDAWDYVNALRELGALVNESGKPWTVQQVNDFVIEKAKEAGADVQAIKNTAQDWNVNLGQWGLDNGYDNTTDKGTNNTTTTTTTTAGDGDTPFTKRSVGSVLGDVLGSILGTDEKKKQDDTDGVDA